MLNRLCARLVVADADAAIAWYCEVLGAELRVCHRMPDGGVVHAELAMPGEGDVAFFVKTAGDGDPDPRGVGGTPVLLSAYTDDVDAVWAAAVDEGAKVIFPLANQFYGERAGRLRDPFGHVWMLSQIVEHVSDEEMATRMAAWAGGGAE